MSYYKLNYNIIFANLFISTIFLSDFGFVIMGQPIYFFQLLGLFYLTFLLINKPVIEKGWFVFFIFVLFSIIVNISLFFESRQFAGDTYPWTSIKGFLNVIIFYAVFKTTLYAYRKINPSFFLYLSIFMIIYGCLEVFFSSNELVRQILEFFHTNPKALNKTSISLLGREHSYGSIGYMISALILLNFYFKKTFIGFKKFLALACMCSLIFFVISAKSKVVFLGIVFFFVLVFFLFLKEKKINLKNFFLLFFSSIVLFIIISKSIDNNYINDVINALSGKIGSGSTFIRFTNLYVGFSIWLENPFFGVGIGNYKLFYVEHIYKSDFPIILDLKILVDPEFTEGSVDPLNFFAGILSELGIFIFVVIFYVIFKKIIILLFSSNLKNQNFLLSVLIAPIIFAASFGFYYWAVSFFPFFLAILFYDYKNYLQKK